MIDEKIEKAAKKHMLEQFYSDDDWDFPCDTSDIKSQCMNDFKAGINWFLGNLWHDAKERVVLDRRILIEYNDKSYVVIRLRGENDRINIPLKNKITRWLYIDDLLKGGK